MGIRMTCFALTLLITPYGWYTWVFAIATAVLPYIAVVFANAINPTAARGAESPTQQLAPLNTEPAAPITADDPTTITIRERAKDDDQ